jgi:type IV pilus assembly protein PilP
MNRRLGLAVLVLGAALAGCGPSTQDQLRTWLAEQRAAVIPGIKKIPTPRPFEHLEYDSQGKIDPFSKTNFHKEIVVASALPRPTGLDAERGHVKQLLENFPLESINFVGTLSKDGKRVALVRVNGMLHQVAPGAYMGQNLGKVSRVDDNSLKLRELTLDGNGHWIERSVELKLQEASK